MAAVNRSVGQAVSLVRSIWFDLGPGLGGLLALLRGLGGFRGELGFTASPAVDQTYAC